MSISVWSEEDRIMAEEAIEDRLQCLRSDHPSSVHHRNNWRKTIVNEMNFLKQAFPDSYILKQDISDVSLALE